MNARNVLSALKAQPPDLRTAQNYVSPGCHERYLCDESRMAGFPPARMWFPTDTAGVSAALAWISECNERAAVSGARTGIAGGAVPYGAENLLSTERIVYKPMLIERNGEWFLKTGAGMTLADIQAFMRNRDSFPDHAPAGLYYPVDPTETSASVGGMIASDASGARTLFYGSTRIWVNRLTVVLPDGSILDLERGKFFAQAGKFYLKSPNGVVDDCAFSGVRIPGTKHVAGYRLSTDMDLIDLFIGGEGTLGVVTDAELRLTAAPECLYVCLFAGVDHPAAEFAACLKQRMPLLALEYMDRASMHLLRNFRDSASAASGVPDLTDWDLSVYYVEIPLDKGNARERVDILKSALTDSGLDPADSWAGFSPSYLDEMKRFRHALPERVNQLIADTGKSLPGLTKIGTDMAVPDHALPAMMETYSQGISREGLQSVTFGHLGNGHLHVNILPRSMEEVEKGKALYREFARYAVSLGGSVAAEHGIGRLKRDLMSVQYNPDEISEMLKIKRFFDPQFRLNPGVLFA
ncbi:MAG: FAD-binding oxidoreductase [Candidatus Wallbacteria bacterium]|nr:FAD-binding oxidoreductase [Candidatus Wallbacteria bacterium]